MELEDLILQSASSVLGGSVVFSHFNGVANYVGPGDEQIKEAVKTAKRIWKEVLRSRHDDD